jgi:succinyl-CoA synthetase alpha subunit
MPTRGCGGMFIGSIKDPSGEARGATSISERAKAELAYAVGETAGDKARFIAAVSAITGQASQAPSAGEALRLGAAAGNPAAETTGLSGSLSAGSAACRSPLSRSRAAFSCA